MRFFRVEGYDNLVEVPASELPAAIAAGEVLDGIILTKPETPSEAKLRLRALLIQAFKYGLRSKHESDEDVILAQAEACADDLLKQS